MAGAKSSDRTSKKKVTSGPRQQLQGDEAERGDSFANIDPQAASRGPSMANIGDDE